MIRSLRLATLVLGLIAAIHGAPAARAVDIYVTGYNSDNTSTFGKIDTATGVYTQLNSLIASGGPLSGLTWNGTLNKFYTAGANTNELNTIDTAGTVGTAIGTGLGFSSRLAYNNGTATLYAIDNGSNFQTVNTSTSAVTTIGSTTGNTFSLAFAGGVLYRTVNVQGGGFPPTNNFRFGTINTATGAFTQIGSDNSSYRSLLLASDDTSGSLFGVAFNTGNIFSVNTTTGALTQVATFSGTVPSGFFTSAAMTTVAVPEPSTYALCAIATGVMAAVARRRKARKA